MMKPLYKVSLSIALSAFALPEAEALEFHGYTRMGFGGSTGSTSQRCFQLPGAGAKYRLGNECDQLFEWTLDHDFLTFDDGSRIGAHSFVGTGMPYDRGLAVDGVAKTRLVEGYVYWKGAKWLNGGDFWFGRKRYKRYSTPINDITYWERTATGFAFEDIPIGDLKYSYAFSRKATMDQTFYMSRHDFNVAGYKTNPGGEVQWGLTIMEKNESRYSHGGWSLTVQHVQQDFMGWGGNNVFVVQYGEGPGTGLGGYGDPTLDNKAETFRVLDFFDWKMANAWSGEFNIIYENQRRREKSDQHWYSVGVRFVKGLGHPFKLAVELGHDQIAADGGMRKLTKFTVAPTWSPSGQYFGDMPEMRLYWTYAFWNRAAQDAATEADSYAYEALSEKGPYGGDRQGSIFGLQVTHAW